MLLHTVFFVTILVIWGTEEGVKTKTSLKTAKGIMIGSTIQDVIASYRVQIEAYQPLSGDL